MKLNPEESLEWLRDHEYLEMLMKVAIADFTRINDAAPLPHMFYDKDGLWKLNADGRYECLGWEEQDP